NHLPKIRPYAYFCSNGHPAKLRPGLRKAPVDDPGSLHDPGLRGVKYQTVMDGKAKGYSPLRILAQPPLPGLCIIGKDIIEVMPYPEYSLEYAFPVCNLQCLFLPLSHILAGAGGKESILKLLSLYGTGNDPGAPTGPYNNLIGKLIGVFFCDTLRRTHVVREVDDALMHVIFMGITLLHGLAGNSQVPVGQVQGDGVAHCVRHEPTVNAGLGKPDKGRASGQPPD